MPMYYTEVDKLVGKNPPTALRENEQSVSKRKQRIRDQAGCRAYWQSVYGGAAERLSRGGHTWVR